MNTEYQWIEVVNKVGESLKAIKITDDRIPKGCAWIAKSRIKDKKTGEFDNIKAIYIPSWLINKAKLMELLLSNDNKTETKETRS